jgi:hypothetical protein
MSNQTALQVDRLAGIDWNFMRLLRWTARTAGAALVGFHAWLLATQWSAGRLSGDPALIMRWAAALVLAAALIWLGREGSSFGFLSLNRRTVVIWLLAALLHAPAVADRAGDANGLQTLPETVATLLLQTTAAAGVIGAAMLALWLVAGLCRRRDSGNSTWSLDRAHPLFASPHHGYGAVHYSIPPPNNQL